MANPFTVGGPENAVVRALAASPRLPAACQRRLSKLMAKSRESVLSASESAELESMLDGIDKKSFWMLARVLVQKRDIPKRQSTSK